MQSLFQILRSSRFESHDGWASVWCQEDFTTHNLFIILFIMFGAFWGGLKRWHPQWVEFFSRTKVREQRTESCQPLIHETQRLEGSPEVECGASFPTPQVMVRAGVLLPRLQLAKVLAQQWTVSSPVRRAELSASPTHGEEDCLTSLRSSGILTLPPIPLGPPHPSWLGTGLMRTETTPSIPPGGVREGIRCEWAPSWGNEIFRVRQGVWRVPH